MKQSIIISILFLSTGFVYAQTFTTRTGFVGFYSKTPLEDIKAENNQVYAAVDPSKKEIAFTLLIKGFLFTKELMQEHFNENYAESDKYPKASFAGSISSGQDITRDGVYQLTIKGMLTLHNVSRAIEVPAVIEIKPGRLSGKSEFKLKPEDFNISIPSIVREKITSEITVRVNIDCNASK